MTGRDVSGWYHKIAEANTGRVSERKNKAYEEIYGSKERAEEEKRKRSNALKDRNYIELFGEDGAKSKKKNCQLLIRTN